MPDLFCRPFLRRLCASLLGASFLFCSVDGATAKTSSSIEQMAGSMLMVGFRGLTPPPSIRSAIESGRLGAVILFDRDLRQSGPRNIESPSQLRALTSSLQKAASAQHLPLLIAVDQEGGKVRRLKESRGFQPQPSAEIMGAMPADEVRALGMRAGQEMAALGINVDLAPVVDVRRTPSSPGLGDIGRLFGSEPAVVSRQALAFAEGLSATGIIPALKHFPGLGSADKDSHLDLPDVTARWHEDELEPYTEAFRRGWPGMVLAAHVYHRGLDPENPSSLSKRVIEGLLRGDMGWQGVVISDDLQMGAVAKGRSLKDILRLAIEAGNDILLLGNNLSYDERLHEKAFQMLMELEQSGEISHERFERSWRRIEALKRRLR